MPSKVRIKAEKLTSLGVGRLTWQRGERVSDRYGVVYLMPDEEGADSLSEKSYPSMVDEAKALSVAGLNGTLFCRVQEIRESTHSGDLLRGFYPRTPKNTKIVIGKGKLFIEPLHGGKGVQVGVHNPVRDTFLDVKKLYQVHEQTVELMFQLDAQ